MGERKLLAERSGFFIEVFCSSIAQMEDEIKGGLNFLSGREQVNWASLGGCRRGQGEQQCCKKMATSDHRSKEMNIPHRLSVLMFSTKKSVHDPEDPTTRRKGRRVAGPNSDGEDRIGGSANGSTEWSKTECAWE